MYDPEPKFQPKVQPRVQPKATVPSYLKESGQVGNWLFYSGAGNKLYDFSGKGYHGTINGSEWNDEQSVSWVLKFGSGDYVKIGDSEIVSHDVEQTVTVWAYLETLPTDDVALYGEGRGGPYHYLDVQSDGTVRWGIYRDGSWYFSDSTATLNTGEWYHLGGTLHSTEGMKTWINGSQDGSNSNTEPSDEAIDEVRIGQNWYFPESLDGMLGPVRLYSRPFSANEMKRHCEATKPLFGL